MNRPPGGYGRYLAQVRHRRPLVHHITNRVVTHMVANVTLAVGASPVMTDLVNEVEEVSRQSQALVLNLGTPQPSTLEAMLRSGRAANATGIPVVFDPVGVGATSYRRRAVAALLSEVRFTAIRGNRAEIAALAGMESASQGVDAAPVSEAGQGTGHDTTEAAVRRLALQTGAVVVATGEVDWIASVLETQTARLAHGHPLLTHISGTGCMLSAVIGCLLAALPREQLSDPTDCLPAVIAAVGYYGLAAERAATLSQGPGSFLPHFFDQLYAMTPQELSRGLQIDWIMPTENMDS